MATVTETEGMDIDSWLKSKKLESLVPKFSETGLTLEDIMQCSQDDIRLLCEENKWSAVIRIKLISAIKSTPGSAASQNQPQIVFLGDKEKEIMDKLYKKTEKISDDINSLQKAINGLEKSAVECNKDIHSKCDILMSIIEKKRKFLLNTVGELKNKRRAELEMELKKLKQMNEAAKKSTNECKSIAIKSDISSSLRFEKMNATIKKQNEIEQKIDFDVSKINKSNVKLIVIYDQNTFNSNFDSALRVQFNDEKVELKYENDDEKVKLEYEKVEILKFSTTYKSKDGLQLSDDNRCVKRLQTGHKYILADIEPVTKGIHCWRMKIVNNKHWMFYGVAEKKTHSDHSHGTSYGVTCCSGYYNNSNKNVKNNGINTKYLESADLKFVDLLLNVDEGTLNICEVGNCVEGKEAKLWGLPKTHGYVPSLNIHGVNIEVRLAKIPSSWYGKQRQNIFG